jgi:hypothetical protein
MKRLSLVLTLGIPLFMILWIALYLVISVLINSIIPIYYKEFNTYVLTPYGYYISLVLALIFG